MRPGLKRKFMMPFLKYKWRKQKRGTTIRSPSEICTKRVELRDKLLEAERIENKERVKELSYKLEVLNWVIIDNGRGA